MALMASLVVALLFFPADAVPQQPLMRSHASLAPSGMTLEVTASGDATLARPPDMNLVAPPASDAVADQADFVFNWRDEGEVLDKSTNLDLPDRCTNIVLLNPPESSRSYSNGGCRRDRSLLAPSDTCEFWWPSMLLKKEWLQFDLRALTTVSGVLLLGNVLEYRVLSRVNSLLNWTVADITLTPLKSQDQTIAALFTEPLETQFLRVVPTNWVDAFIRLRAAVLTCTDPTTCVLDPPETWRLYSSVSRASEDFSSRTSMLSTKYFWRADGKPGQWMEIDLGKSMAVMGVVVNCLQPPSASLDVSYSSDRQQWSGTSPSQFDLIPRVERYLFQDTVAAQYVRISPSWTPTPVEMRAGLLVCDYSPADWVSAFNEAAAQARSWTNTASMSWSPENATQIQLWLGVEYAELPEPGTDVGRAKATLLNLGAIMDTIRFFMPQRGTLCAPGVMAYTGLDFSSADPVVYICAAFFDKTFSKVARAATLLHEALHCSGLTDLNYGKVSCRQLPTADKMRNANNYLYFLLERLEAEANTSLALRFPNASIASQVDCQRLQGSPCQSEMQGVCKMRVHNLRGQSCNDYCEVHRLYCKAAFTTGTPECSMAPSSSVTCILPADQAICWCKPAELAFFSPSTDTTTPARPSR